MLTTQKTCFKCGESKPYSEFYKHPKMADGHLGKCKECTKKDATKHRGDNLDSYREYDRKRGSRQQPDYQREYREKYPKKYKAHCKVNNAVRDGKITPATHCETCGGNSYIIAHHDDYDKPLDVRWLCQACHCIWHAANGEAANPF